MKSSKKKENKMAWPKIGTVRKGDNGPYIKLEADITILKDGKPIELNNARSLQLQDPVASLTRLNELGFVDNEKFEAQKAKLAEMSWLKFDIVSPPPKTEQ